MVEHFCVKFGDPSWISVFRYSALKQTNIGENPTLVNRGGYMGEGTRRAMAIARPTWLLVNLRCQADQK